MSETIDSMRRVLDQFRLKKRAVYFPGSTLLRGTLASRPKYQKTPPPITGRAKHLRSYTRWNYSKNDKEYHIPSMRPYNGCVYFIQDKTGRGLIKIGFSKRLDDRLYEISLKQEGGFTFLGKFRGLPVDERIIHKMFWQFRVISNDNLHPTEWFYPVKPILFFVKHFCISSNI